MSYLASSNGPERLTYIFTQRVYDDYLQCRAAVKVRIAIRLCNEDFVFCFKDFPLSRGQSLGTLSAKGAQLSSHVTIFNAYYPAHHRPSTNFIVFLVVPMSRRMLLMESVFSQKRLETIRDVHHDNCRSCNMTCEWVSTHDQLD